MKVCIVSSRNLRIYPLTKIYINIFEKYNIKYDVIYMDRIGVEEKCTANNCYKYTWIKKVSNKNRVIFKVLSYINYKCMLSGFRRFTCGLLKKNKYDFIVLWGEETAFSISDYCAKHFPGRYSVNIRDIWDLSNNTMNKNIERAVQHSAFNTVSSDGFIPYLPKADYMFIHSANDDVISSLSPKLTDKDEPIVILSVGSFRNDKYSFEIMDCFANDERFLMKFVGPGTERMKAYCESKNYNNVVCSGGFALEDTSRILDEASIINCAYGANNIAETSKMPIRFYYSIYKEIPILMTEGTRIQYYGDLVGVGITLPADFSNKSVIADEVYRKYSEFNHLKMCESIATFKNAIDASHLLLEKAFCDSNGITIF